MWPNISVSRPQISRIEAGKSVPTYAQVAAQLVRLFNTSYEYLLEGTTPPAEPCEVVFAQRTRLRRIVSAITNPTAALLTNQLAQDPADTQAMG